MYQLKNYCEEMVDHLLDKILNNYSDICKCEKCRLDIKAVSLNSMNPKYIVTNEGEIYTKINSELVHQEIINTTKAITQAIELVSRNPQH